MKEHRLTTIDNPHNPFKEPNEWRSYDLHFHNDCCTRLVAVFASDANNMTEEEADLDYENAIERVLELDDVGIFIRVTKETDIHPIPIATLMG